VGAGDLTAVPTFPTFADGHHEVLLCEAVLRSHRELAPVLAEKDALGLLLLGYPLAWRDY
jgi:hypothetical protein